MQSVPEESTYSHLYVVQRSAILDRTEAELGSALFVTVGGSRPAVTEHQVIEEVARSFSTDASVMSILMSALEDFILVLPDIRAVDRVLNNDPPLLRPSFSLLFKCWTRRAHADGAAFLTAVDVELRGIPAHAWDKETVQQLLNGSCWIGSLHLGKTAKRDLSVFRAEAWCSCLDAVPTVVDLLIPEALPPEAESPPLKPGLVYPIAISVSARRGEGDTFSPPPPPGPEHGTHRHRRRDRSWSSQLRPSGTGSEASTHGQRAPMHSRLGPKVTCMAPTTEAAHAADPEAHVPSDSPLPYAPPPIPNACPSPDGIDVEDRCGTGDEDSLQAPPPPGLEHGTHRHHHQDRSWSSQLCLSGTGSEASTCGSRAPVHSRLGPKVTRVTPTTEVVHAPNPEAHVRSNSSLPYAPPSVPNACPSPDGIDVEDHYSTGDEDSLQAPTAVTTQLLSPLLQQTKRGEHGGPQGDCSKPTKDGSDGALPKAAHFFRAPDGDCEQAAPPLPLHLAAFPHA
jgi:hypothetical protein